MKCTVCDKEFERKTNNQVTCSAECGYKRNLAQKAERRKTCPQVKAQENPNADLTHPDVRWRNRFLLAAIN